METVGIKESLEVFDAVDAASDAITAACSDGKLNLLDIPKLLVPIKATAVALKGKEIVLNELKDADEDEVATLVTRALQTAEKAAKAFEAIGQLKP